MLSPSLPLLALGNPGPWHLFGWPVLASMATSQSHSPASPILPEPNEGRGGGNSTLPSLQLLLSSCSPLILQAQAASYPCRGLDTGLGVAHVPAAMHSRPRHWKPSLKKAKMGSICISQFIHKHCKPRLLVLLPCLRQPGKPSGMALTHSALEQNKRVSSRALHKVGHSPASKSCARAQGRTKPWGGDTRAVLQPPG